MSHSQSSDLALPHRDELESIAELLEHRAAVQERQRAYAFLDYASRDGEPRETTVSYGELHLMARGVAASLQPHCRSGDRALLLFPAGVEYLAAFFGCLYAGVVAVPAYPPEQPRLARRMETIARDCDPAVVLTAPEMMPRREELARTYSALQPARWIGVDAGVASLSHLHAPGRRTRGELAFLQYTSGSSGRPKGVIVTQRNLLDNLARIEESFGHSPSDHQVMWLPPYHDMGLIASLLSALYSGHPCSAMSPFAFLQEPARWLLEVSRRRATAIGAPNFGYELAARKTPERLIEELDLSCLRLAFCGAEPIRAETIERFSRAFATAGLKPDVFSPGYGLAEATVLVSLTRRDRAARVSAVDREAYQQAKIRPPVPGGDVARIVSCGPPISGHELRIVDPESGTPCRDREIGEIWLAGPSVARGYWGLDEETESVFGGALAAPEPERRRAMRFLRTGDLGFVDRGEVFVTGRLKDLIILRGANHYPQDIEATVERADPGLRPGCSAAFSVDGEGEEQLVIVSEARPGIASLDDLVEAIRRAVLREHQASPFAITLLAPRSLPKTSSGKVARRPCRAEFEQGTLRVVHAWTRPERGAADPGQT